jgi:Bacterial regulatory proteins, luxR family
MVRGRLNKQIAFQLGTSERTIKAHRHMVMHKLNVQSFAEAVSMAVRLGIVVSARLGHERATLDRHFNLALAGKGKPLEASGCPKGQYLPNASLCCLVCS